MPTGYTSDIYNGKDVSFEDFVWTCARGMGALVMMRDEPMGAPIPDEFAPSSYHTEELEKARGRLAEVESWDYDTTNAEALRDYNERMVQHEQWVADKNRRREAYEQMLAQVKAWIPPTSNHDGLKKLMAEQLERSVEFDCSAPEKPTVLSGFAYQENALEKAQRGIERHTEEHTKEVQRANERTQWVQALRESFKTE